MSILKQIYEYKKEFVKTRKISNPLDGVIEESDKYKPKGFISKIETDILNNNISIIGELKKASPSAGIIFSDENDYHNIANKYENNGISCLSILTDEKYFKGSDNDLEKIRSKVKLPIIRKDFIVDRYQLFGLPTTFNASVSSVPSKIDRTRASSQKRDASVSSA